MKQYYLLKGTNVIQVQEGEDEDAFVKNILGRVVKDHEDPGRNFVPLSRRDDETDLQASKSEFDVLNQLLSTTKSLSLRLAVEKIFNIHHESTASRLRDLRSKKVSRHFLTDTEALLDRVRSDEKIRERLKRWLVRGGDMSWVIVGFLTAEDVEVTGKNSNTGNDEGGFKIPASADGQNTAVELQAQYKREAKQESQVTASKKSVFAIEYLALQRPRFVRGQDFDVAVRRGPQGPNAFGPGDTETNGEEAEAKVDLLAGPVIDALKMANSEELESEDCGEFSFAFDVDEDAEAEEEDDDDDDDDGDEDE
ncbi:hypothetical protein C8A05DRAFT_36044 [Staphylotrichum tortipilum]|uniref:Uncharacterized protein n=1 Tax=Staphylotrichum tortipilum TaxID=2831512 RepID=A0AAN6MGK3_9PEZI|nr:hypothetical protein C8A05DRAFT_36044 [Staphylotrichum longicolle]